jgi:CheY-like chemotaxis protein
LRHLKEDDSIHFAGGLLLLAEDNLLNQQVANGVLENAGFQVMVAQNGVQAVRMAQERQFDGVLMDIQMPEMDGYTATEKIRQLPGYKKIPIIAMTAYASNEAIAKMRQAGMDEHIAKPIDLRRLFSVLARWFTATDQPPAKVGALDAACPHQEPGAGVAAQGQMLDKDELAARLRSLIPVLRDSRPKACSQAFAALNIDRWPKSPRGEIERIRRKVDEYNFAEAISLTETLLQGLQGEHNA